MDLDLDEEVKPIGPISAQASARDYLEENNIPQMFKSLISALMMEQPDDMFKYLDSKLEEIKMMGADNVNWDTFIRELHPMKDPHRRTILKEDEGNSETDKKGQKPFAGMGKNEEYKPQVFKLTEASD